tara:strand:- start:1769 stop:2446 length:678 start_codon:yes stop_codon:yes gene_type:complete
MTIKKGDRTRTAILDATISCYHRYGYGKTTQDKVAEIAGISMGAITYHYPTLAELTYASIEHIYKRRIENHRNAIETAKATEWDFDTALEVYWASVVDPLFISSHEISLAARTDPALAAILGPLHSKFWEQWRDTLKELYHEWTDTHDIFDFAVEYSVHLTEGMALDYLLHGRSEKRMLELRDYMKDSLESLLIVGQQGMSVEQLLAPGRARRAELKGKDSQTSG